jgi:hypothetical protein
VILKPKLILQLENATMPGNYFLDSISFRMAMALI